MYFQNNESPVLEFPPHHSEVSQIHLPRFHSFNPIPGLFGLPQPSPAIEVPNSSSSSEPVLFLGDTNPTPTRLGLRPTPPPLRTESVSSQNPFAFQRSFYSIPPPRSPHKQRDNVSPCQDPFFSFLSSCYVVFPLLPSAITFFYEDGPQPLPLFERTCTTPPRISYLGVFFFFGCLLVVNPTFPFVFFLDLCIEMFAGGFFPVRGRGSSR